MSTRTPKSAQYERSFLRSLISQLFAVRSSSEEQKIALDVVFLLFVYVASFGLNPIDPSVRVAASVIRLLVVFVVPTLLIGSLLGFDLNEAKNLLYTFTVGLVYLVAVGLVANAVHLVQPQITPRPFNSAMLHASWFVANGTILGLSLRMKSNPVAIRWHGMIDRASRKTVLLMSLPILALVAGLIVNWYATNWVMLAVYGLLLSILLLTLRDKEHYGLFVWSCAASLTVANSAMIPNLINPTEFYHANLVLHHGIWDPSFQTSKNSVLVVVLLQPVLAHLSGLPLDWLIKFVYPVLLASAPFALFTVIRMAFSPRIALYATLIFVFSFPFFTRLNHVMRTGFGILFAILVVLVLHDHILDSHQRGVLLLAFAVGTVTSHYGVGPIFFGVLVVAAIIQYIESRRLEFASDINVPITLVILYGVILYTWYVYTANSHNFSTLTNVFFNLIIKVSGYGSEASGASRALQSQQSLTMSFVKMWNIIILGSAALGVAIAGVKRLKAWLDRDSASFQGTPYYHSVAIVSGGLLGMIAFAPTEQLGISRLFMTLLPFFVPYCIVAWLALVQRVPYNNAIGWFDMGDIIVIAIVVVFLFNTGIVATLVTHDRSPQPSLDRGYTLRQESTDGYYYQFSRRQPPAQLAMTSWGVKYMNKEISVYRGDRGFQTQMSYTKYNTRKPPGINLQQFSSTKTVESDGYIILEPFNTVTSSVYIHGPRPYRNRAGRQTIPISVTRIPQWNQIYDGNVVTVHKIQ